MATNLYWLDLETTGLDPSKDEILEIAVKVADLTSPFDTRLVLDEVIRPFGSYNDDMVEVWDFERFEERLDPYIHGMHTGSGLLADVRKATRGVMKIEKALLDIIPYTEDREDMPTLAGSSVHFDAAFLKVHMPTLAARFSHRYYDVSAVKLFCRSLGMEKIPKAEAHRALSDIDESIAHARLCVEWLHDHFRNPSKEQGDAP